LLFEDSISTQEVDEGRPGSDSVQGLEKPLDSHMRVSGWSASTIVPEENQMELDQKLWSGILLEYVKYQEYTI
jgi:hypothetical protein